jgi:hypothetical protein
MSNTGNILERPRLDDENIFSATDRQNLVNIIMEYITDDIVQDHIDNSDEIHSNAQRFSFFIRNISRGWRISLRQRKGAINLFHYQNGKELPKFPLNST